jgi:hypothetical protein
MTDLTGLFQRLDGDGSLLDVMDGPEEAQHHQVQQLAPY